MLFLLNRMTLDLVILSQYTRDTCVILVLSNVFTTRGHQYKLYKKHSTGVRALFFCERVINAWNKLPDDTNLATNTLATFKPSIKNINFTGFLKRF